MLKKQSPGVISMITSIMVSILVITMAMGLVVLTTGGTQQSSDDELSLRASAAAQGGVEWAYWWAQQHPNTSISSSCQPANIPGGFNTGIPLSSPFTFFNATGNANNTITCIKVNNSSFALSGELDASKAYQVLVPPLADPLKYIQVNWISKGSDLDIPTSYPTYAGALPTSPTAANPPGIELTIVNFQTNDVTINPLTCPNVSSCTINPGANYGNVNIRNVVLLPNGTSGSNTSDARGVGVPPTKILVACNPANTPYECSSDGPGGTYTVYAENTTNDSLPGNTFGAIVYVRAVYPTPNTEYHYSINLYSQSNALITPTLNSSIIDVTAKAGPVYRRIVATSATTNAQVPAGLNYVLFSDTTICKDFSIFQAAGPTYTLNRNTACTVTPGPDLGL